MVNKYYTLPLQLNKVMKKQEHPRCNLHDSIGYYIHLMIGSQFKENKYDENFGNVIWDNEFTNITKNNNVKEQIKISLLEAIVKYESRLENVRVDIQVHQEEINTSSVKRLRERVTVEITGVVSKSKERFRHREKFFIAPLSYY